MTDENDSVFDFNEENREEQAETRRSPTKTTRFNVTQRDIFTRSERIRFMRAIKTLDDLLFCRLGFYGGLRVSEITNLCPQDLIFNGYDISPVLHIRESKGGKSRYSCIDEHTAQLIMIYADMKSIAPDSPLFNVSTRTLQRRFEKIMADSGIGRISATPHTMRHTNITMLLDKGMDIEKVRQHAGHEDIATTMIYTHLTYHTTARQYADLMGE